MINDINKNTWCVNPYMNISVQTTGATKPCCMIDMEYRTDANKRALNEASIIEFWNSKDRINLINTLENGIKHPACWKCWKEEDGGKISKRLRDNALWSDKVTSADMYPIVVDLALGNVCNIKCRICNDASSSPWKLEIGNTVGPTNKLVADGIKTYEDSSEETKIELEKTYPILAEAVKQKDYKKIYSSMPIWTRMKESFSEHNSLFWDDIVTLLPDVVKLDFAGGEPFYIEKHWDLVKSIVEKGWSKRQHIHYNTNGTIYPEKYIPLLEQFKIVDIQVSSDGVGEKFEYLRHPAKWEVAESTIDQFCQVRDNSKTTWIVGTCLSISAFNVYEFFETFEHYANKNISIYINVVLDNRGITIMPPEIKKIVVDKLRSHTSIYKQIQWQHECDMVCKIIENSTYDPIKWHNWIEEIKQRDSYRKESFAETFPEFYQVIKDYFNKDVN